MPEIPRHIRLITFDLDDTLWPCGPVIQQAEQALYAWLQDNAPRITLHHSPQALREQRLTLAQQRSDIAHDLSALRQLQLTRLLAAAGYETHLAWEAMQVFLQARHQVSPYKDVLPVLEALQNTYTLIALTNGNADIRKTSLTHCFHGAITAAQAGAAKPDPAMFLRAMEQAGASPEQSLHVGDDPLLDMDTARQQGMHTLWINRTQREWPDKLPLPTIQSHDLKILLRYLYPVP